MSWMRRSSFVGSRRFLLVPLLLGIALVASCGSPGDGADTRPDPSSAAYPITVEHALGSTTVETPPRRVVALGSNDADIALALGIAPVAIRSIYDFPRGVGPWAEDELGSASPLVMGRQINYEMIASAQPDLILNVKSSGDRAEHETLSRIAPTVALPVGAAPYAPTWQATTRLIATALGRVQQGEDLVARTEGYLNGVATANPTFAGRTLTYLDLSAGRIDVGGRNSTTLTTMRALGFRPVPYVRDLPQDRSQNQISPELVPRLDADVVLAYSIGYSDEEALRDAPAVGRLEAVRAGRARFLPDLALSSPSVLSIPYGVDGLLPFLRSATAGGR